MNFAQTERAQYLRRYGGTVLGSRRIAVGCIIFEVPGWMVFMGMVPNLISCCGKLCPKSLPSVTLCAALCSKYGSDGQHSCDALLKLKGSPSLL